MKKISELTPISGEIQEEDILVVNTAGGTRKITYAELCEAVKITLGIREVVESVNITEPGFLMDGQTASEALAQLNGNIEQLGSQRIFYRMTNSQEFIITGSTGEQRYLLFGATGFSESGSVLSVMFKQRYNTAIGKLWNFGGRQLQAEFLNNSLSIHITNADSGIVIMSISDFTIDNI